MDSVTKNPFKLYDQVTGTDASLQFAHARGFKGPPSDVVTVVGVNEDTVSLSDASHWHYSHLQKAYSNAEAPAAPTEDRVNEFFAAVEDIFDSMEYVGDFCEFPIIEELKAYIGNTYSEHYAKGGVQSFSLIAKRPQRGLHFALSNIIKYADRFGEKDGMNRRDLLKIAHYAVLAIYCCDEITEEEK